MKIAIATDAWFPQVNGVVRTLAATVAELDRRGYEVELITPKRFATLPMPGYSSIRLALAPRSASSPLRSDIRFSDVVALIEEDAREIRQADPEEAAELLHQAGLAYQAAGDHRAASRIFADAAEDDPGASYIRYDLAQSLIALNDDSAAEKQLEQVVRIARASDTYDLRIGFAQRDLALIAMRQERYADAVQLMLAALDDYRWAYLPHAHETLAQAYDRLGDADQAGKWRHREAFLQGRD